MKTASRCFWSIAAPRASPGAAIAAATIRGRRTFRLSNVSVADADVLGEVGKGLPIIQRVVEAGIAATAGETVGAMEAMNEMTLEYSKTRVQFGKPIGSYQVVQHRLADMFMAQEQGRSMAMLATMSIDNPDEAARRAISRWPRSASDRPDATCRKAPCRCMAASA